MHSPNFELPWYRHTDNSRTRARFQLWSSQRCGAYSSLIQLSPRLKACGAARIEDWQKVSWTRLYKSIRTPREAKYFLFVNTNKEGNTKKKFSLTQSCHHHC